MSAKKLVRAKFVNDKTEVQVPAGTLVSKAAAASGRPIEMPCGGMGTCGKCLVKVKGDVSEADSSEKRAISESDLAEGYRLACRTVIQGDVEIEIPETSLSKVQKILRKGVLRDCKLKTGITKEYCKLTPPSLEDERAEFERVKDELAPRDITLKPRLESVAEMSRVLREADYQVTAVTCGDELIAIEPGDTTAHSYGIAYDLGSTSVVGYLMDLVAGKEIAVSAVMNPQIVYGDDLVARIHFAENEQNGRKLLQEAAVDALNRIAKDLARQAEISTGHIYKATVVGNTCMTHILLGIDPRSLGQSPYVPTVTADISRRASEMGLDYSPQALVTVLPNVAGFVGSDLVGVLLASMWTDDGRTRLAVDIGTNGEMALMHKGETYVCSAAAGPAFEGAGISCGMRGAPGAIDNIKITSDSIDIHTINERKPAGICGSGIVDAIAQMLDACIIDESGRMVTVDEAKDLPEHIASRIIEGENGSEFVLAEEDKSATRKPLTLTAGDIRGLQLVKGSIHAAIQSLVKEAGIDDSDIDEIMLAGAFGNYISVESAIRIGLIPWVDAEKVISIGNAAGAGARLALLCDDEMQRARDIARGARHLELAVSPHYQMELMERMMFPEKGAFV